MAGASQNPGPALYAYRLVATFNMDALNARCPHFAVGGLGARRGPAARLRMGNSEVGHLNIGAGRVVYQDMTRIDVALEDGSFAANPVLKI